MLKGCLTFGALSGFTAVVFGAFGAHALKHRLTSDMMAVYQTAVSYHFYHTLALILTVLLSYYLTDRLMLRVSSCLFIVGILIFSGSLYLLSVTGMSWIGAITPIGGVAFMLAWLCLAVAAFQMN